VLPGVNQAPRRPDRLRPLAYGTHCPDLPLGAARQQVTLAGGYPAPPIALLRTPRPSGTVPGNERR